MINAGELPCVVARGHADIVDLAGADEALGENRRRLGADSALDKLVARDADADDRL